ncbi:MAG: hypothetical protein WAW54_08225 [Parvibaculum sedimenti]|uniref:hypothetical protein n=1 Tax=Parvibaculum sedimenti TaxID=2608632 RepID=UPI003BB77A61
MNNAFKQVELTVHKLKYRHVLASELRRAWYFFKLLARQNVGTDKNFFTSDAAVKLSRGVLPQGVKITCSGRADGIGMQALTRMSTISFAKAFGATYVHSPFTDIDHSDGDPEEWVSRWERFFNFGKGEEVVTDRHSVIDYADYLTGKEKLTENSVLRFQQCWYFTRRYPNSFLDVRDLFRKKMGLSEQPGDTLSVAVHVRRGDVGQESNSLRFTPNSKILQTIKCLKEAAALANTRLSIAVFSQGSKDDFQEFVELGCSLHLDTDALDTLRGLIESDILVMSKSSFSYVAALYNNGVVIYEPTFNPALDGWLIKSPDGSVDPKLVADRIKKHIAQSPAPALAKSAAMTPAIA